MSERLDALKELARRRASGQMDAEQAAAFDELRSRGVFRDIEPQQADIPENEAIRKGGQYASGAIEGIANPIVALAGAGTAVGGPVLGLIGAGIGLAGELPHMIAPNTFPSPSDFIRSKLREYGITQAPDQDSRFGRRVAEEIGGAFGASGGRAASFARNVLLPASTAGVGAATAREVAPDNPIAELSGQIIGGLGGATVGGMTRGLLAAKDTPEQLATIRTAGGKGSIGLVGNRFARSVEEGYLSKAPGGVGPVVQNAEATQEGIGRNVKQIVKGIGGDTDIYRAGRTMKESMDDFVGSFKKRWVEIDSKVNTAIPKDHQVKLTETQKLLDEFTTPARGFEKTSENLISVLLSKLKTDIAKDVSGTGGKAPYSSIRELRTFIGRKLASAEQGVPRGELKQIYKALSNDLRASLSDNPPALKAFDRSNKYYTAGQNRIEDYLSRSMDMAAPERVVTDILSGAKNGATRIYAIRRSVGEKSWKDVQSILTERLGRQNPSMQNDAGDVFSTERFLTNWNGLDSKTKAAIYGTDTATRRNLDVVAKAAARIRESGRTYRNPSQSGMAAGSIGTGGIIVGGTAGALFGGTVGVPVGALSSIAVNHFGSKLFTNQKAVDWLAKSTRIVKPEHFGAHVQKLTTLIKNEKNEEQKQELQKLQDALSQ